MQEMNFTCSGEGNQSLMFKDLQKDTEYSIKFLLLTKSECKIRNLGFMKFNTKGNQNTALHTLSNSCLNNS